MKYQTEKRGGSAVENAFELMEKYNEQSAQANNLSEREINAKSSCCDCSDCCCTRCFCLSLFADGSCC